MRKNLNASLLAIALGGAALIHSPIPAQSQPNKLAKIYIVDTASNVINEKNRVANIPVLVTLFSKGQAIRNTTINNIGNNTIPDKVIWEDLAPGAYEVHFEARDFGKVIKRVILTGNTTTSVVFDTLTKSDELWGPGPSIFELQARIAKLEKENAQLKDEVATLEKDAAKK